MHNSNFTIGIFTASAFVGRMSVALSVGGVGNINWGFIRRNTFHSSALRGLRLLYLSQLVHLQLEFTVFLSETVVCPLLLKNYRILAFQKR